MRRASLKLVPFAELAGVWRARGGEPPVRSTARRGAPVLALEGDSRIGYLVHADGFGASLIAADGRRILVTPGRVATWRWQRLLTAQALPIAALLQGLELFHASAVQLNGRAFAFTGPSGAGKTTLAARLLAAGGMFMADDVLALEPDGDSVIAHPGPALMNLREPAVPTDGANRDAPLGAELGRDEGGRRLLVPRKAPAQPLAALYVLRRPMTGISDVRLKRLSPPGPAQLLGAAFGSVIHTPDRLIRRLDVCAHLARTIPVFELQVSAHAPPDEVAQLVLEQARRGLA